MKHLLFSYGTLQLENVQIENYGRILFGTKDTLKGYRIESLNICDKEVIKKSGKKINPVAIKSKIQNDKIDGIIFEITEEELNETDKFEVSDYERIMVTFESGKMAWIYIAKQIS